MEGWKGGQRGDACLLYRVRGMEGWINCIRGWVDLREETGEGCWGEVERRKADTKTHIHAEIHHSGLLFLMFFIITVILLFGQVVRKRLHRDHCQKTVLATRKPHTSSNFKSVLETMRREDRRISGDLRGDRVREERDWVKGG